MIWKTITLLSLALCVLSEEHHAISEQRIKIHKTEHHEDHDELKHIGSSLPEHHEEYAWTYPSYEFSYKVHDPHTHDMKGHEESRHGDDVKGEYWLIQPDGHKRTVTYHADKHSGFKADVKYSEYHHEEDDHGDDKKHDAEEGVDKEDVHSEDVEHGKEVIDGGDEDHVEDKGHKEEVGHHGEESRSYKGYRQAWAVARKEHVKEESRRDDHRGVDMVFLGNMGGYGRKDSGHGRDEIRHHEESHNTGSHKHSPQNSHHAHDTYNYPRFYRHTQGQRPRQ